MFPPTWTYLHTGHKPIKQPKYMFLFTLEYKILNDTTVFYQ